MKLLAMPLSRDNSESTGHVGGGQQSWIGHDGSLPVTHWPVIKYSSEAPYCNTYRLEVAQFVLWTCHTQFTIMW